MKATIDFQSDKKGGWITLRIGKKTLMTKLAAKQARVWAALLKLALRG